MARKKASIGKFNQLWQRHELLYRGIFEEALKLLEISDYQRRDEDAISEALCIDLVRVCFSHRNKPMPPQWEGPISPVLIEELKGGKSRNRPDFTCKLVNTLANSYDTHTISLHIECKRLGEKTGSWDLKRNYVRRGVNRFNSRKHEYGKQATSGMIIGYIVSENKPDILNAVNGHLAAWALPQVSFVFAAKVEICEVNFYRDYVEPNDFKLVHIWADLRSTSQ